MQSTAVDSSTLGEIQGLVQTGSLVGLGEQELLVSSRGTIPELSRSSSNAMAPWS